MWSAVFLRGRAWRIRSEDLASDDWNPGLFSRRSLIGAFGSLAALAGVSACSGGGGGSSVTSSASATASATATASASATASPTATASSATTTACAVTPEGEIGPYFTDDSLTKYNRSSIVANLDGSDVQSEVPLTLTVFVHDTENSCAAYPGAQVDIWQCNANGVYSNESSESTTGQSWLRDDQITDSTGKVTFSTIIPGWYGDRTNHIHLRVRSTYSEASSTSDGTNTTQLFFAQSLINTLAASVSPYSSEGLDSTTNATDHVHTPETKGETLLSIVGSVTERRAV
jgi:protocatechuate 3,4-dioxygenase beta subunit